MRINRSLFLVVFTGFISIVLISPVRASIVSLDTSHGTSGTLLQSPLNGGFGQQTSDGGYLFSKGASLTDSLYKIDSSLNYDSTFGGGDGRLSTTTIIKNFVEHNGKIYYISQDGSPQRFVNKLNSDGTPDNSFGTSGVVTHPYDLTFPVNYLSQIFIDSNNKIVLAGYDYSSSLTVIRLNADGSIDSSFGGGDGIYAFDSGGANVDAAYKIYEEIDGSYTVLGILDQDPVTFRLTSSGNLDLTYGTNGFVDIKAIASTTVSMTKVYQVNTNSSGEFFVAGSYQDGGFGQIGEMILVDRDGSLISSFANQGVITIDFWDYKSSAIYDDWRAMEPYSATYRDGYYYLVGWSEGDKSAGGYFYSGWVARYDSNGDLDSGFGDGGIYFLCDQDSDVCENELASPVFVSNQGQIISASYYYTPSSVTGISFFQIENQISSLPVGLQVYASGNQINTGSLRGVYGASESVELWNNSHLLATIETDMLVDRNWSGVTGAVDVVSGKAVVSGLTSAPGTAATHTLYIPIPSGASSSSVVICPSASVLGDVNPTCPGAVTYVEADAEASKINIGGQDYWAITGMTGTGGISITDTYSLKDTLTRLEISQASDHTIEFGSVNDTNTSGDTIVVQFDSVGQSWDLSSIGIGDIDLEDDGVDKTLAGGSGADIWGVSISLVTDTITFTAPTSGTDYISAGSTLVVKVGTNADGGVNQIVNPSLVNSYEVSIVISNSSATETGEIEIPIVDDDTVNVTGYIDSFLTFDIDTSEVDEDCDSAGAANPCDSHGGSNDNAGYIVDLGELSTSSVNDSGDTVVHQDGLSGEINSIYFDLSSNSSAAVSVVSLNASMASGISNIPTVSNGIEVQITAGSGLYGINSFAGLVNSSSSGAAVISVDCDGTAGIDYYCDTQISPSVIFDTGGAPIDNLRLEWEVGVSPDALDGTGTYTDELTFIATATF